MAAPKKWQPEWDLLLGKMSDVDLARRIGMCSMTVLWRRNKSGIKPFCGPFVLSCHVCGTETKRKVNAVRSICKKCKKKYGSRWHAAHREARTAKMRAAYRADPESHKRRTAEWQAEHPEKVRIYHQRSNRRLNKELDSIIRSLPCLDCGMRHDAETRARILSRMLPCSTMDVHGAWPCIWGEGGQENKSSAGTQMLRRDMKAIGAVRSWVFEHSPVYSIPAKRSAA